MQLLNTRPLPPPIYYKCQWQPIIQAFFLLKVLAFPDLDNGKEGNFVVFSEREKFCFIRTTSPFKKTTVISSNNQQVSFYIYYRSVFIALTALRSHEVGDFHNTWKALGSSQRNLELSLIISNKSTFEAQKWNSWAISSCLLTPLGGLSIEGMALSSLLLK